MSTGSPCPTCRNPMTWEPAFQQWRCNHCRQMFAAQPVALPFPMAIQPKKKSGWVLAISLLAIGGAALAITVIAVKHRQPVAAPMIASDEPPGAVTVQPVGSDLPPRPKVVAPSPPPAPRDLSLGTPEAFELADLWMTPRHDGAYLITSPILEAVFAHKPMGKVDTEWTLSDDLQGRGLLALTIASAAGFSLERVKADLVTPVESQRSDRGYAVTRFESSNATTGETTRIDVRLDTPRTLVVIATAKYIKGDAPTADAFLDSVHLRAAGDPADDPKALTVRVRKERGENQAHDTGDLFAVDLPWTAKVARLPTTDRSVAVTVSARSGKARAELAIVELSPWAAVAETPRAQQAFALASKSALERERGLEAKIASEQLGGITATRIDAKGKGHSLHTHIVWNRFQHRRYTLTCVDAPCDVIALSLRFAAPVPVH